MVHRVCFSPRGVALSAVLLASVAVLAGAVSTAVSAAPVVQQSSPTLSRPVLLSAAAPAAAVTRSSHRRCPNRLARVLKRAGFTGENLAEAWAIATRESHGVPAVVSATGDRGLFQFNTATWDGQRWWDANRLLHARYNARVAYRLSHGGRTWYPWGLDGDGRTNARAYRAAGWSQEQIRSSVTRPYRRNYRLFWSLPRSCR